MTKVQSFHDGWAAWISFMCNNRADVFGICHACTGVWAKRAKAQYF